MMANASGKSSIAITADPTRCEKTCRAAKAITNERRYSVRGAIQSSGTEAMSVEMNVVTASIRLEGTNANATHLALRRHAIGCSSMVGVASDAASSGR